MDETELLIWNPYSLDELLNPSSNGGSGDYNAFIQGISIVDQDGSCVKPTLPDISAQRAEVLPVVTRCRANYQQKQWDEAVLSFVLYSMTDWEGIPD